MNGDDPMLQSSIRSRSLGYFPQISLPVWGDLVAGGKHRWLLGSVRFSLSPALLKLATVMSWCDHLPRREL